jgi:hypothetical protein
MEIVLDATIPQIDIQDFFAQIECPRCTQFLFEKEVLLVPSIRPRIAFKIQEVERVTDDIRRDLPTSFREFKRLFAAMKEPIWNVQKVYCVRMVPSKDVASHMVGGFD